MGGRVGAVKEKRKQNKMSTKRKINPITHANRRIRRHIGEFEGISACSLKKKGISPNSKSAWGEHWQTPYRTLK